VTADAAAPSPQPAPNGQLALAADPATGPGWEVTTPSRHHAAAIAAAIPGTTTHATGPGQWRAQIPRLSLAVTATAADADTLTCHLDDAPGTGDLTLTFQPWTAADVLPRLP
jgi:hypothetical protein